MAMAAPISPSSPTVEASSSSAKVDPVERLLRQDSETYNYGTVGDLGTRLSTDNIPSTSTALPTLSTVSPTQEQPQIPQTLLTGRRHSSILNNHIERIGHLSPSEECANGGPSILVPPHSSQTTFSTGGTSTWSTVVLIATMCCHASSGGFSLSGAVLYNHIVHNFNGTTSFQAVWAVSLSWSFGWILSPLLTAMAIRYGARPVCLLGAFITALGTVFNSFSYDLAHVYISFSLITSLGNTMCHVASLVTLTIHYEDNHQRVSFLYRMSKYLGLALFAIMFDYIINTYGWSCGLQISTAFAAVNFISGFFYNVPKDYEMSLRRRKSHAPLGLLECMNFEIFRQGDFIAWTTIHAVLSFGVYPTLILSIVYSDDTDDGSFLHLRALPLVLMGLGGAIGTFCWHAMKACVKVSQIFITHEQLLVGAVLVIAISVSTSTATMCVVCFLYGLVIGGLATSENNQLYQLVEPSKTVQAQSWLMCAQGLAIAISSPIAVWLNASCDCRVVGYFLSVGAMLIVSVLMLCFAKRLQLRQARAWSNVMDKLRNRKQRQYDGSIVEEIPVPLLPRNGPPKERNGENLLGSEKREDSASPLVDVGYVDPYSMEVAHFGHMSESSLENLLKEHEWIALKVTPDNEEEDEEEGFGRRRTTLVEPTLPVLMEVPSAESSTMSNIKIDKDKDNAYQKIPCTSQTEEATVTRHTPSNFRVEPIEMSNGRSDTATNRRRKYGYFRSHSTTCAGADYYGRGNKMCSIEEQTRASQEKEVYPRGNRRQSVPLIATRASKITRSVEDGYNLQLKRNSRGRLIESSV